MTSLSTPVAPGPELWQGTGYPRERGEVEVSEVKRRVRAGMDEGKIDREGGEAALSRIERAENEQSRVENDPDATEAQKTHALDEYNAAAREAAELLKEAES